MSLPSFVNRRFIENDLDGTPIYEDEDLEIMSVDFQRGTMEIRKTTPSWKYIDQVVYRYFTLPLDDAAKELLANHLSP